MPFLIAGDGLRMEDSQVICAYLDHLDGQPRLHPATDFRLVASPARGIGAQHARRHRRVGPRNEPAGNLRSPTALAHEAARTHRMADLFEGAVVHPVLQAETNMAQLVLAVALETARARKFGDLTDGRPHLAAWLTLISQRPAMLATARPSHARAVYYQRAAKAPLTAIGIAAAAHGEFGRRRDC